ncbi:MAG: hypothetical protein ABIK81_04705 [candidate division WOR-3 bacterium]
MKGKIKMLFVLIFFLQGLLIAGPVGRYLGIREGKMVKDSLITRDSIHFYAPPRDTVWTTEEVSFDSVVKETLRLGNPAYIFKEIGPDTTLFDTLWEERNIYLMGELPLFDTLVVETIYKVPFSINSFWSTGLGGFTYIGDLDNGGQRDDTLAFLLDSVRVVSVEDVSVPYGFIPNAYKIRSRQVVTLHGYNAPNNISYQDTMYTTRYEWYKDSLWRVKDSVYLEERFYASQVLIWNHIGRHKTLLLRIYSPGAIEEENSLKIKTKGSNVVRGSFTLPEGSPLYDNLGKKVRGERNLPAGVYYAIIKGNGKKKIVRIVKIK